MTSTPESAASLGGAFDEARELILKRDYEEAINVLGSIDQNEQNVAEVISLFGVISYFLQDYSKAIELFIQAEELPGASTDLPEVLAILYALGGKLTDSLYYGKLSTMHPMDNRILGLLGSGFPSYAEVFTNIKSKPFLEHGKKMLRQGAFSEAISWLSQHIGINQTDEEALYEYAEALYQDGRPNEALNMLRSLRSLAPGTSSYASLLGRSLDALGRLEEASACHRQAIALESGRIGNYCSRLRNLAYTPNRSDEALAEVISKIREVAGSQETAPDASYNSPPDSAKIKIAYLVVSMPGPDEIEMLAEIISSHDRDRVVVYGIGLSDLTAERNIPFRNGFDRWTNISTMDVATLAATVRNEGVDVLIDASGINSPVGLTLFPYRAAPVQVAWLGTYLGAAVDEMGFRLVDNLSAGAEEKNVCAPWPVDGLYALKKPYGEIGDSPAQVYGNISFGSDVSLAELNIEVALTWAQIVQTVPNSQLLLYDRSMGSPEVVDRLLQLFGNFGIAHRIDILSADSRDEFFREVDVALAPFPFQKPYAAAAALAKGVPVVSLDMPGEEGESVSCMLKRLKLDESMLAVSKDDYLAKALNWATDVDARIKFRTEGVEDVLSSSLFDPKSLAKALEDAYFGMWQETNGG
ncbi:MAG: tetratricopeptide repeat protein [Rhodospirillales bacterium]|nr:tetratricopeptide repeat protein [Rhodospirillales bacterium]